MKRLISITLLLVVTCSGEETPRASGIGLKMIPENTGAPTADVSTDEAFLARRAKATANAPAQRPLPPQPRAFGLMEMSSAIQSGTGFILVPKGSVLFQPARLNDKRVAKPLGKLMDWSEFMRSNRSWITTYEVTSDQVTGKTPIPPDDMERFQKGGCIVLATFQGGPITVIKPASP